MYQLILLLIALIIAPVVATMIICFWGWVYVGLVFGLAAILDIPKKIVGWFK